MKVYYVCEFSVQLDAAVRKIMYDPFRVVHECILEFNHPIRWETEKMLNEHGFERISKKNVEIVS